MRQRYHCYTRVRSDRNARGNGDRKDRVPQDGVRSLAISSPMHNLRPKNLRRLAIAHGINMLAEKGNEAKAKRTCQQKVAPPRVRYGDPRYRVVVVSTNFSNQMLYVLTVLMNRDFRS